MLEGLSVLKKTGGEGGGAGLAGETYWAGRGTAIHPAKEGI